MQYNFNTDTLIGRLLPNALRKPKLITWLKVLNKPVQTLYALFSSYRNASIGEVNKNGQVIVLQHALTAYSNSHGGFSPALFPDGTSLIPSSKKIFVEDYSLNVVLPAAVKLNEELIASDILQVGLIEESDSMQCCLIEETQSEYDFQVRVDKLLINDLTLKTIRSVVDRYKVMGRKYAIIVFEGVYSPFEPF